MYMNTGDPYFFMFIDRNLEKPSPSPCFRKGGAYTFLGKHPPIYVKDLSRNIGA